VEDVLEHEDEEEKEELGDPEFVEHALVVGTLVEIIRCRQEMITLGTTKAITTTIITMKISIIILASSLGAVVGDVVVVEDVDVDVVLVGEVGSKEAKALEQHHQAV